MSLPSSQNQSSLYHGSQYQLNANHFSKTYLKEGWKQGFLPLVILLYSLSVDEIAWVLPYPMYLMIVLLFSLKSQILSCKWHIIMIVQIFNIAQDIPKGINSYDSKKCLCHVPTDEHSTLDINMVMFCRCFYYINNTILIFRWNVNTCPKWESIYNALWIMSGLTTTRL